MAVRQAVEEIAADMEAQQQQIQEQQQLQQQEQELLGSSYEQEAEGLDQQQQEHHHWHHHHQQQSIQIILGDRPAKETLQAMWASLPPRKRLVFTGHLLYALIASKVSCCYCCYCCCKPSLQTVAAAAETYICSVPLRESSLQCAAAGGSV